MLTDPIADFLTRIRNAILARRSTVDIPASNLKRRLAAVLVEEGYLEGWSESQDHIQGLLTLKIRWADGHTPAITGLKRVSTPGQRRYVSFDQIPKVRRGLGTAILSTSRGVVTDREARKLRVGGEVLCEVW